MFNNHRTTTVSQMNQPNRHHSPYYTSPQPIPCPLSPISARGIPLAPPRTGTDSSPAEPEGDSRICQRAAGLTAGEGSLRWNARFVVSSVIMSVVRNVP